MRVIAGRLGRRRLHAPRGEQTRPTHDRVKEALFSVIGRVDHFTIVDLYAGTGALGIEALSRGASRACFVEQSRFALDCLRRNLTELDLVRVATVLARSVEHAAPELVRFGPCDLAFCDPPWPKIDEVLALLSHHSPRRWLSDEGMLILEHPAKFDPSHVGIKGLMVTDQRHWGDTGVTFFAMDPKVADPAPLPPQMNP